MEGAGFPDSFIPLDLANPTPDTASHLSRLPQRHRQAQALDNEASISTQTPYMFWTTPQFNPRCSQNVPGFDIDCPLSRSQSNMGFPTVSATDPLMMSAQVNGTGHHAVHRDKRSLSQQAPISRSMLRNASTRSESAMPFRPTGRIAPLAPTHSPALRQFYSSQEEPANQRLPSVQEHDLRPEVGVDPEEFINAWPSAQGCMPSTMNFGINPMQFISDGWSQPYPPTCPSMVSMPTTVDGPLPLTRQNSTFGSQQALNMARLESSQSQTVEGFSWNDSPSSVQLSYTLSGDKRHAPDQYLFGLGASHPPASQLYSSTPPGDNLLFSSPGSVTMDRTASNDSNASSMSTASAQSQRNRDALTRVVANGKTSIAPKRPLASDEEMHGDATGQAKDDGRRTTGTAKTKYKRRKQEKVFCKFCNEHTQGFRGEHELRRHTAAKHHGVTTKFVCRDPTAVGITPTVQPVVPLSKCKACLGGKQYGAYYNAAAHLRRAHFKPKPARGKKSASAEKRGGKAGGKEPRMEDLKAFFKEVSVRLVPSHSERGSGRMDSPKPFFDGTVDQLVQDGLDDESNEASPDNDNDDSDMLAFDSNAGNDLDADTVRRMSYSRALQDTASLLLGSASYSEPHLGDLCAEYRTILPGDLYDSAVLSTAVPADLFPPKQPLQSDDFSDRVWTDFELTSMAGAGTGGPGSQIF
ncbi:hypothetical protein S40293_07428 [Stachybotrys chartarum IBT 40293]|nr:hypothetical protein S40293_07428 [Stachybotrys chartarum IBT 40293]KFA79727.1 hypothetical protein S40288_00712 [Stachybotrys chartarum IBT 40288]